MKKYALVINDETKLCEVGLGSNTGFYKSVGMTEMEVEQAYDGKWYLQDYAPKKPTPTYEEIKQARQEAYRNEVDPITCHIQRLSDEVQTDEIISEIAALVEERKRIVAVIKEENPYLVKNNKE